MSERTSPPAAAGRRCGGILPGGLAAVLFLLGALIFFPTQPAQAAPLALGDVLVGLGSAPDGGIPRGEVRHFTPAGVLVQPLLTTSGSFEETGMCLDAAWNLYTTNFQANSMSQFASDGTLAVASFWVGPFTDGAKGHPNSCAVDAAGNLYVGLSDTYVVDPFGDYWAFGGGGLLKLSPLGIELATFSPAPDQRGTDWVDLAADQSTLFYTSVGSIIRRFDVSPTGGQLTDF
jgi:sugar lactone lactonase YvrE